jgi:hypothetical protein
VEGAFATTQTTMVVVKLPVMDPRLGSGRAREAKVSFEVSFNFTLPYAISRKYYESIFDIYLGRYIYGLL